MSLRILVADDQNMYLEAIKATLERDGYEVVGLASNGRDAIHLCRNLQPNIAVLDASMPHVSGIDAAREIMVSCPKTQTAILAERPDRHILETLKAGVKGYFLKSDTGAELSRGLQLISKGETYVATPARAIMKSHDDVFQSSQTLGPQERRVLRLIAEGRTTEEIALLLAISYETVRSHRKHIMSKLSIRDTAGLVRYSILCGLSDA
jgi:two-component system response regulator NreC